MRSLSVLALLASLALGEVPDSSSGSPPLRPQDGSEISSVAAATRTIYLHPFFLLVTAMDDRAPFQAPLTFETELEGNGSLVVQPTLVAGSMEGGEKVNGQTPPRIDARGGQILASYRIYPLGTRHEGFFAAGAIGGIYVNLHRPRKTTSTVVWYERKGTLMGPLAGGYLGFRQKWGRIVTYSDLGGVYSNLSITGDRIEAARRSGFDLDLNFGIGCSF